MFSLCSVAKWVGSGFSVLRLWVLLRVPSSKMVGWWAWLRFGVCRMRRLFGRLTVGGFMSLENSSLEGVF